jgi:glycosyltransferase involved in cell wall biosynthesis
MRILCTHPSAELYGSDRMALLAVGALTGKGHTVKAVVPVDGLLVDKLRDEQAAVTVKDIPVLRRADLHPVQFLGLLWRVIRSSAEIFRIIRAENPNILYVNTIVQPWWIVGGKMMGRKVVVHVREAEDQAHPLVRKVLYSCLLLADLVVFNSEATRREITSMVAVPVSRRLLIYNGKDWANYRIERERRVDGSGRESIALAVIGRLSHRKGQDVAVRALGELVLAGYDARLTVVGGTFAGNEDYSNELIALARVLDVFDRINFMDFQEDIRPTLLENDIAIVPSRIEPFGTVAAESMAAGLLTIVADVQGLTEIVDADRNGLTFPSGDHKALAQQCIWAATHPEDAAALALQGQRDVNERFGLDRYQRQIVEALESVDIKDEAEL